MQSGRSRKTSSANKPIKPSKSSGARPMPPPHKRERWKPMDVVAPTRKPAPIQNMVQSGIASSRFTDSSLWVKWSDA